LREGSFQELEVLLKAHLNVLKKADTETAYGLYASMIYITLAEVLRQLYHRNIGEDEIIKVDLNFKELGKNIKNHLELVLDLLSLELVWLQVFYQKKTNLEIDFLEKLRRRLRYVRNDAKRILETTPETDWLDSFVHRIIAEENDISYIR